MRLKKRNKSGRFRGSKTHARGFKKKARGSGHQGGVGMAGTGKRGDQKKTMILNLYGNDYFGKDRALRRGNKAPKLKVINLQYIQDNLDSLVKKGLAKEKNGTYDINLKDYKILGEGTLNIKANIESSQASESTVEKMKKMGSITVQTFASVEKKVKEVKGKKSPQTK